MSLVREEVIPVVPLRYRLALRQSVPVLLGLACTLGVMLLLGYFFARNQIVDAARAQISQLAISIGRQDDYSRQWIEGNTAPIVTALEQAGPVPPPRPQDAAGRRIITSLSTARGQNDIVVQIRDRAGQYHVQRYAPDVLSSSSSSSSSLGLSSLPPLPPLPSGEEPFGPGGWQPPRILAANDDIFMKYLVPLRQREAQGQAAVYGMVTVTTRIPWLVSRVQSISTFKDCVVFFQAKDGAWTLPSSPLSDPSLGRLNSLMRSSPSGVSTVVWKGQDYFALFMPLKSSQDLLLGVLVPREELLGSLHSLTWTLALLGISILALATWLLRRTALAMLQPLGPLTLMANRLAHGKLSPTALAEEILWAAQPGPDEAGRLLRATERLRLTLKQRLHDLTLVAVTRERLFGELDLARTLQEAMRPACLPHSPEVETAVKLYAARHLGGTMYDCFFRTPRQVCCVMGTVPASGLPAALLMGRTIPLLHEVLLEGISPGRALNNMNKLMLSRGQPGPSALVGEPGPSGPDVHVRLFAGVLHLDTGLLVWASAGQALPYRIFSGSSQVLQAEPLLPAPWADAPPLGLHAQNQYPEQRTRLKQGELLFFCNDGKDNGPDCAGQNKGTEGAGLAEQAERAGLAEGANRLWTEASLEAFLTAHSGSSPQDLLAAFDQTFRPGHDPACPLTLFALRWLGKEP